MLSVAVGHSNDPDSREAVKDVIEQCQQTLTGARPLAGLLYAAIDFEHQLILEHINMAFPGIHLIGGTTDGEVSSVLEFQQDSLTLMLFWGDDVEIKAAVGRNVSQDPVAISAATVQAAQAQLSRDPKFCIALPESLTVSATSILRGLQKVLGSVPIYGGATADQAHMTQTYQFYNTEVLSDSVPILLWAGNVLFSHGVTSGWKPLGRRCQITKAEQNVIYEIDYQPALEFYRYYIDEFEPDIAYPLAIYPSDSTMSEEFFLRGAVGHDQRSGSITVSGDVLQGADTQITEASTDDIIAASQASFQHALQKYPGQAPTAALLFSCSKRRYILGTRTNEEYQKVIATQTKHLPSCGFYTYGEIAPFQDSDQHFIHNTTFVVLLLGSS